MSAPYRIVTYRNSLALAHSRPRIRIALGTNDRGLAEARAKRIWAARTAPKSDKCEDLWAAYIADREAEGVNTKQLNYRWRKLEPFFGYKLGQAVTKEDCKAYAKQRRATGVKSVTVRTELVLLRACLNLRYGRGNTKIWTPEASPPRDRYLTREELEKLLESVETPHVRLFVVLAVATGARMTAILQAKWSAVDWSTTTINYDPPGRVKTNKRRPTVPLNKRALVELKVAQQMAQTDHIIEFNGESIKNIRKGIEAAARRSGVPCSPHVFRHTAGVWMAQADVPMSKISQYLGHTTTKVTEATYARYSPSFMKDAADALDW
jgi:integrase